MDIQCVEVCHWLFNRQEGHVLIVQHMTFTVVSVLCKNDEGPEFIRCFEKEP